jgi:hypothetical protein
MAVDRPDVGVSAVFPLTARFHLVCRRDEEVMIKAVQRPTMGQGH